MWFGVWMNSAISACSCQTQILDLWWPWVFGIDLNRTFVVEIENSKHLASSKTSSRRRRLLPSIISLPQISTSGLLSSKWTLSQKNRWTIHLINESCHLPQNYSLSLTMSWMIIPSYHCKGAWYIVKICFFRPYLIHQEGTSNVSTLPMQILSLNCFIRLSDDPKRIFTVEIEKTKNVSILKRLIKEENPSSLGNVNAKDLDLWNVSESFLLRDLGQKDVNIHECMELLPSNEISAIFEKISHNCLHVIAKDQMKVSSFRLFITVLF